MRVVVFMVLVMSLASCAKSRAAIDYTMTEGIIWPGPPERPRIKYLWSLQRVSGGEGMSKMLRYITGDTGFEVNDPRASNLLIRPHGIYVDKSDNLYIVDTGVPRVSVVNLTNMNSFNIDSAGKLPLLSPIGVVADLDGRIYITDAGYRTVMVFNGKGKLVSSFDGDFRRPTGIAINHDEGAIYVADTWAHAIYIYGLDGRRRGVIGSRGEGPGKLNYPTHISVGGDGFLYVSDTLNFRVQVFTGKGEFINAFGLIGDSYNTFDKIKGIALDSEGHVYVADSAQDMIKIYNNKGQMLLYFGGKGSGYGYFSLPTGIFIDDSDRIFVSDSLYRRIQVFQFLGGDQSVDQIMR
jgi:DNA-binding beta-propeller fold protein YncE